MDGKVEISILQFNELQDKLKVLETENATYKESVKKVKLTIVDKQYGGFHKYNPWSKMNEFVSDEKVVESTEYVNLEDVTRVLRDEEEKKVKAEIEAAKLEQHRLEQELSNQKLDADKLQRRLLKSHLAQIENVKEGYEEKLDKLKENHKAEVEEIHESHSEEIKELTSELNELKGIKESEEELSEIESLKKEIVKLKDINENLKQRKRGWFGW